MWVGTSLPPTPDKSFGLIAVNLSPFGFQILYQSVMNVAGDTKEGLLKCVLPSATPQAAGSAQSQTFGLYTLFSAKAIYILCIIFSLGPLYSREYSRILRIF